MPQCSRGQMLPDKSEERKDLVPEAHEEGKTVFIDSLPWILQPLAFTDCDFHIRFALLAQLQLIYQLSTRRAARYWVTNAQVRPSNASTTLVLGVVAWHAMLQESVSSLVRL